MVQFARSSGNLAADRRFDYGRRAAAAGEHDVALDLFAQTIELTPEWPVVWFALALSREASGDRAGAISAFRRTVALDPAGSLGAPLHLARLGDVAAPAAPPDAYVRDLFDQYAERFERHLVDELDYCGPKILADALARACAVLSRPLAFETMLDLGCGTGLVAGELRAVCRRMAGVDIAPAMVAQARATGLYERLETGQLQPFLDARPPASASLVTAADVFVYMGDLAPTFASVRRVIEPGGLFAFTVQIGDGEFSVGPDLRYRHGRAYLERLADANGLAAVASDVASIRRDRGQAVPGLALVLAAP